MKKLLSLSLGCFLFAMSYIGINFSPDTMNIRANTSISESFYVRGNYIINNHKDKCNFWSFGVKGEGHVLGLDAPFFTMSVVADVVYTYNNAAIPVGIGFFSFIPDLQVPVFLRGEYEYALPVASFRDANRFHRVYFETGIAPIDTAEIYVGYRNLGFNTNYNSTFYLGVGYNF
ncbi:MAG: hypothetical protein ABGX23_04640 [Nautiliaceae bacterium]